ncbi:hypothetical protein [Paraburkholderia eburnea]|uniref:hypothetical protein n=1 Tax=Paraburkholderia eburnea TaxID=1189126 RepID=UPI0011B0F149|nr:hypothetical protein [Paraburkholderia eburnea]
MEEARESGLFYGWLRGVCRVDTGIGTGREGALLDMSCVDSTQAGGILAMRVTGFDSDGAERWDAFRQEVVYVSSRHAINSGGAVDMNEEAREEYLPRLTPPVSSRHRCGGVQRFIFNCLFNA